MPCYLGTKEAAKRLRKNNQQFQQCAEKGKFPARNMTANGSPWRIPEEAIE